MLFEPVINSERQTNKRGHPFPGELTTQRSSTIPSEEMGIGERLWVVPKGHPICKRNKRTHWSANVTKEGCCRIDVHRGRISEQRRSSGIRMEERPIRATWRGQKVRRKRKKTREASRRCHQGRTLSVANLR